MAVGNVAPPVPSEGPPLEGDVFLPHCPVAPPQLGVNYLPEVSTWGGNSVFAEEDFKFHIFYSEMSLGCGLNSWGTNS